MVCKPAGPNDRGPGRLNSNNLFFSRWAPIYVHRGLDYLHKPIHLPRRVTHTRSMESKPITLIRELVAQKPEATMKLRLIRLWKLPLYSNPTETFSIEMVLMDEEGTKIQGTVVRKYIYRFEKLLWENSDFYVHQPQVCANSSKYNYFNNPYKLSYTCDTKLARCIDFNGALYGFSFANFQSILEHAILDGDVVGDTNVPLCRPL